jgi:hypothetical protein
MTITDILYYYYYYDLITDFKSFIIKATGPSMINHFTAVINECL